MKWEGKFSSLKFPQGTACGDILVDKIDVHSDGYSSFATIKYTGIFRKGKSIRVPFTAQGTTMSLNLDDRHVTFTIKTKEDKMITGSYIVGKIDHGQFYLQPEGSPKIPNEQGCIVQ